MTRIRALAFATAVSVLATSGLCRAESADQGCFAAFESAQQLRKEGKLIEASKAVITCSQPTCQSFISKECTAIYGELQASLPSFVFSAKQGERLLLNVRIYVDGVLVAERIDGRAVPVDPGPHQFKFEVEGRAPIVVDGLAIEGERNKPMSVTFPAEAPGKVAHVGAGATQPEKEPPRSSGAPIASYVLAGVGVLAVGGAIALRVVGANEFDDMNGTCKPTCARDDVDRARLKYTLSDVGFGVGGAALVTAGILYLVRGTRESAPTALSVVPVVANNGAAAVWRGSF
ncbi:MAG: hypothetical protein ACOY0T_30935 [Myxococcota bacterium]